MSYIHPAWVEHQRQRWLRPDWQRWVRHDAHRFAPPEAPKSYAARRIEQRQLEEMQTRAAGQDALRDDLERLRWLVRDLKIEFALRRLRLKYDPDQPRDELGRWTDSGGGRANGRNDPRVISDAQPDNEAIPGAQYAQGRTRSTITVRVEGRTFEVEGGQAARLTDAQARADAAISRIREIDPSWHPTPSFKETVEGSIRAYEAEAKEAQAYANELAAKGLCPGPFASESIPARGPERNFTAAEHNEINRIGSQTGCHTCSTTSPSTPLNNFVVDHQPPTALNSLGRPQRLYPQCASCSAFQGGWARSLLRSR